MVKKGQRTILGLDLGTNSIGWALLAEEQGELKSIIDLGSRIFTKAVEEKTPTPKNVKRRDARLGRRVLQRRARRKQRMLNFLVSLDLLPQTLQDHTQPEIILNRLGDPYTLRAAGLDQSLRPHELGRVLLHLVQRRGFLSNRKTLLGDLIDDPDVQSVLHEMGEDDPNTTTDKEEGQFKQDISLLRTEIQAKNCRTLGDYLSTISSPNCRRNRIRDGGHLRTDRQMYREELDLIWQQQALHHTKLTNELKEEIEEIIFYQRPLKLRADRVGKCSLESKNNRARLARLEVQQFRYLQDINNLQYLDHYKNRWVPLSSTEREKLTLLFESKATITFPQIRKTLDFDKKTEFNLEKGGNKKLKGNITITTIQSQYPDWDQLNQQQQQQLVEDLITIQKKSVLKRRLMQHWKIPAEFAIHLCMVELEPGHSNLSLKAINKLLPHLLQGNIYSDARKAAGYGYEAEELQVIDKLGLPPEIPNPIVQKGLHELRRLLNAIIAEYGKPDAIRIEMARDLEMNTKRYKSFVKQQNNNTKANDKATDEYRAVGSKNPHLQLRHYPSHNDKLKYRLWSDQEQRCAYSNQAINMTTLFTAEVEIDHILPFSESLDDSYMNKVVCFTRENRYKGQRTPIDAYGGDEEKWNQIAQSLSHWASKLKGKRNRFYMTADDVQQRDFISSQLNDTRYISKVALEYLEPLGVEITTCKGATTAQVRHWWGLNSLIGETNKKERTDHRHHAIDAVVIATIDRRFYNTITKLAKEMERSHTSINDLHLDPPWKQFRSDLEQQLQQTLIAHTPQRKLSGALHEETGVGFIEGKGCVERKNLDADMSIKRAGKIIDDSVRELVLEHLQQHGNNPKQAFAEGFQLFHKDGKTPIKRVRIIQSSTTLKKLEQSKFGVRNESGVVFKWHAYGNLHHVEIIHHRVSGKVSGQFITTMEATHRARGIGMPKQPIIQKNHGADHELLMALHINDLVSVEHDGERVFYRVQKLESGGNKIMLRLHTAALLNNKNEELRLSINKDVFEKWSLRTEQINVIGKPLISNDQTHR